MFILKFVIVLIVAYLLSFFGEKILRRVINVEKRKSFIYQPVNKSQKKGERVLLVLFFISLFIQIVYSSPSFETSTVLIIFLIVLNLYRAFMEWKYQKESKEYIITLCSLVFFAIFIYFIFKLNVLDLIFN